MLKNKFIILIFFINIIWLKVLINNNLNLIIKITKIQNGWLFHLKSSSGNDLLFINNSKYILFNILNKTKLWCVYE